MICPHCKKPIPRRTSKKDVIRIIQLGNEGYSTRDISSLLQGRASFATVARILRKHTIKE